MSTATNNDLAREKKQFSLMGMGESKGLPKAGKSLKGKVRPMERKPKMRTSMRSK